MNKKLLFVFLVIFSNTIWANVSLPNIFSDNMVLQRNSDVKLWGFATPKEEVKITTSWDNKEYSVTGNNMARWEITIPTPNAGGPFSIAFKGYNEVVLNNILIGEVWLCSGQSNMEMTANWGIDNGEEEIKNANYPTIRFFTVSKSTATTPQNNIDGKWEVCTPETMKNSSAIAYFFAQHLQKELPNIPIGIVVSAWGGTPAEVWIPENTIQNDEVLNKAANKLNPSEYGPIEPARAFNAMIHPIIGFKMKGVLWYQGESNVGSSVYDKTFSALINSWRKFWNEEFPFYFVQIAPFQNGDDHFCGVEVRNAQRKVLELPNTAMVVTSDISTTDDIHPKDKKSVGIRLANLALNNIYKTKSQLVNGPLFDKFEINKNKIIVHFKYADGLYFKSKKSNQFEIAGQDGVFHQAEATIKNQTIVLFSNKVNKPTQVRYAWKNKEQADLFNKANLPASSFITE